MSIYLAFIALANEGLGGKYIWTTFFLATSTGATSKMSKSRESIKLKIWRCITKISFGSIMLWGIQKRIIHTSTFMFTSLSFFSRNKIKCKIALKNARQQRQHVILLTFPEKGYYCFVRLSGRAGGAQFLAHCKPLPCTDYRELPV